MLKYLFVFVSFVFCFQAFNVKAEISIDLTSPNIDPVNIAVTNFHADNNDNRKMGQNIAGIISSNLENSGLFSPINPRSFIQTPESISKNGTRFAEWRMINAQILVSGIIKNTDDGKTRVEFRLWDSFSERQLSGMAYMTTPSNWRRIAHVISDEIYSRITGEDGYFDSRIVYISEYGSPLKRIKRLAIMDQDGHNHKYLTDGNNLVLTPRFSPTDQVVTYVSYVNKKPRVYLYNIDTGKQRILGDFPGMTFAPRFSPDGEKVVMSLAQNGNSDVYLMDIRSKKLKRLTDKLSIDTSPSFSADGNKIVFESDRGGSQQLYIMNSDGSDQHRITFTKGRYGNPVWSPRGDLIAFTKILSGKFYIGVIRPDGTGERLIANAYHVEGPSWSPNGRVLTYFKENPTGPKGEGRSARIYTIDITGYNEKLLKTPRDGSDPAWSPLNR